MPTNSLFIEHLLFEMILFGFLGLGLEAAFTAVCDCKKDPRRHLFGYSSLWYMPLYALTPLFLHLTGTYLFDLTLLERGLIYMLVIFAVEYAGMWLLRKGLGSSPSEDEYYKSRWHLHGLIRLDFAPAWFLAGLLFEQVFRWLH